MNMLRLLNWAGGGLPGGLALLGGALLLWWVLIMRVIRSTGVFRDRNPLGWLAGGWLVLLSAHLLLCLRLSPPAADGLVLWPPEAPASAAGEGVFARAEQALRLPAGSGPLRWGRGEVTLRILQHQLDPGRVQPATTAEAAQLLAALNARLLVNLSDADGTRALHLWRLDWRVCTLEDLEPCPSAARPDSLESALHRLLGRHFPDWQPPSTPWTEVWLPLYQPVADSARAWIELPGGLLPPWEDLRRSDLQLALAGSVPASAEGANRALALAETHPGLGAEPWLIATRWFARQGDWDQARQALANALSREPGHPQIYWQLAQMAPSRLSDFGYANRREARARCLDLLPSYVPAALAQANDWMSRRQGPKAVAIAEAALVAYPRHAELQLLRGNLAYELLDHEAAEAAYRASLEARPGDPRAWMNLGQLYIVLKEWAKAIPALERAVALGSPPQVLHLLGVCHARLGHRDAAAQYFNRRLLLGGERVDLEQARRQLVLLEAADSTGAPR